MSEQWIKMEIVFRRHDHEPQLILCFRLSRWIPACAEAFVKKKELWQHLVPCKETDSTERIKEFFSSTASLMSNQLRSLIINSLEDFLSFFEIHKVSLSSPN